MTEVIFWILVILWGAAVAIGVLNRPIQPRKKDDDDDDDDILEISIHVKMDSTDNTKHTERTYEHLDNHNIHLKL